MILLQICLITLLLYSVLVITFIVGWKKNTPFTLETTHQFYPKVSIVIACKNEATHLPHLLKCLSEQSYQDFELILVDDHSTDQTHAIMILESSSMQLVKIINSEGFGKKAAIKQGILNAQGELIVTTDADCVMESKWLETLVCFYSQQRCDLIIGPVKIEDNGTFFSKLQGLEFATLVASGAGAAGVKRPILCNAANLAFTKKAWIESQAELREDLISGDDIFLLQSIKKRGGKILFIKSTSALVLTQPAKTIKEFLRQRERWASKAPAYTDGLLVLTSCIILSINVAILSSCIVAIYTPFYWKLSIVLMGVKYITDLFFIANVRKFFSLRHILWLSFILSIVYPFYIVLVAGRSVISKPNWK